MHHSYENQQPTFEIRKGEEGIGEASLHVVKRCLSEMALNTFHAGGFVIRLFWKEAKPLLFKRFLRPSISLRCQTSVCPLAPATFFEVCTGSEDWIEEARDIKSVKAHFPETERDSLLRKVEETLEGHPDDRGIKKV